MTATAVLLGRGDTAVSDHREERDTLPTPSLLLHLIFGI